jgi:ATP synthase protein I
MPPAIFLAIATDTNQEFAVPITGRQPIITILLAQALASGLVAAGLALWLGRTVGVSALLGGAVAVLPNAFLAARLLTPGSAASAKAMLRAAWLGEVGKLIMTAVLFAAVFIAVKPLSAPAVFGGFIAAQLVIFCAPLMGSGWLDGKDGKAKI